VGELPAVCFPADEEALSARVEELKAAGLGELWTDNIYGVALGRRLGLAVRGGFGLNIANARAAAFYEAQGLRSLTLSFELPLGAVRALGGGIPYGAAAYGRLPLMRFRNCPVRAHGGCAACGGEGGLRDRRGIEFPVECGGKRYSTLLNSVPLSIAGRDDPADFRLLWFTRESREECARVLRDFRADRETEGPRTGGLYYRKLM
jgi:putative protease